MIFSYKWLKEYFEEDLPQPESLVELLTTHSFEIEGLEEKDGEVKDWLIDIDVLPNRAHDALCHYGMAREISTITGLKLKEISSLEDIEIPVELKPDKIKINVEGNFCRRYIVREIRGIKVEESPKELKEKLQAIGQRSINNIVDITNIVMFELNQPMHAFDTDKLDGDINVRFAKEGEQITTLDNNEVDLDSEIPLIADHSGPLAIAGVKGGKKAEVNSDTQNIILESANFEPTLTRKTSSKTDIKTDSSKRFENEITPELADKAIDRATELIMKYASSEETEICESVDHYPNPVSKTKIELSVAKTNALLGSELSVEEITEILNKLYFENEIIEKSDDSDDAENPDDALIKIIIPYERLDLNIQADLIEEVGRVYGYNKILDQEIPDFDFGARINNEYAVNTLIRKTLVELGFSEIMTSSFTAQGVLAPEKPAAKDRQFLRDSLQYGMTSSLELNQKNADWLGLDHIKLFEIGKVFVGEKENYSENMQLCLGVINKQGIKKPKPATFIIQAIEKLSEILDYKIGIKLNEDQDLKISIPLESIYEKADIKNYAKFPAVKNSSYTTVSQYPFVLRDIAVWIPNETSSEELVEIIKNNAGDFLIKEPRLFDEYQKDDRISYAYRLVFQSHEKTLTDDEVNKIMDSINSEIESKGWEIR